MLCSLCSFHITHDRLELILLLEAALLNLQNGLRLVLGYQQMGQSLYQHYHLHLVECQLVNLVLVAVPVYLLVLLQDLERLLFALRWVKTCLFMQLIFTSFTVLTVL